MQAVGTVRDPIARGGASNANLCSDTEESNHDNLGKNIPDVVRLSSNDSFGY